MSWAWIFTGLAAIWALLYFRVPLWLCSLLLAALLAFLTWLPESPGTGLYAAWIVSALVLLPLNLWPLRRWLISNRVMNLYRRLMPPMSVTEREALEAGTVWWDGELFSGKPDWKRLLAYPAPVLSDEERAFIDGPVETLCAMLDDWEITHERADLPPAVWDYIRDNGFLGMIIPRSYGGLGFSAYAHSCVVMKIASRSVTAAVTVMVPNSLGPAELLLHYGTDAQKHHYLPRLARGDEIPCFALTGPWAGSDAGSMPDTGIVCRQDYEGEKDVLGIRLNWEKRYITLGPVATVLGLAFKLYDPDGLLGGQESLGITLALIPTDTPGIEIGRRHLPLNIPFQNGPNRGRDVFIPMDWVIGGQAMIGKGWQMLMESLAAGRSISLPALSTGAGKLAARATGAYARIRRQFHLPIGYFEGVEEALARIAARTWMMDAVRTLTVGAVDLGEKPAVISAIAKYNLTETMRKVVDDAMDIQGGSGICLGPSNFIGRTYQAVPISITVEGANILTRSMIIFGQGAMRCHPWLIREIEAVRDDDQRHGRKRFDRALFGHIGFTLSNIARAFFLGLSGARLVRAPDVDARLKPYYRQITRMSAAFALISDMSLLALGGALKRKEKLSGRLADCLSHLYLASASLRHYQTSGRPEALLPLVRWSCEESLHEIQKAMIELLRNYPLRPVAWLLRILVFPFGQRYRRPADDLGHICARLLLSPSPARDMLTAGIYAPREGDDKLALIEQALEASIAIEPVERLMRKAVHDGRIVEDGCRGSVADQALAAGIIDAEQHAQYIDYERRVRAVIMVDDFDTDFNRRVPPRADGAGEATLTKENSKHEGTKT